jgi:hypothetical protein
MPDFQANPMRTMLEERDEKLRLVLSASQMEKLEELEPARRWLRGGGPGRTEDRARNRNQGRGDQTGQGQ